MLSVLFSRSREELFRWRSPETSRIEGFSDAAFGFAITLLVVSLEVPRTAAELFQALRGFVGFAFTFGVLFSLWKAQFTFFRRYGLEDETTINLTGVFLFLVMFSVYPLKFLLGSVVDTLLNRGATSFFEAKEDAAWLMFLYGIGFAAIFATLAALYAHAYSLREKLALSEIEVFETVQSIRRYLFRTLSSVLLTALPLIFSMSYTARQRYAMPLFTIAGVAVAFAARADRMRGRRRRDEIAARLAGEGDHPAESGVLSAAEEKP